MWDWDWDMDGELSEEEFINLVTYLDEDQYLTDEEYNYAIQQFQWADPTCAIWLTDTLSSTSAGEDYWEDLDLDEFVEFGEKLGGDDDELEAMFYNADWDGSGDLDIWEQDSVWYDLMEQDMVENRLYDIEEAAWDILDAVWDAQDEYIWGDDDDCWCDGWDCGCW